MKLHHKTLPLAISTSISIAALAQQPNLNAAAKGLQTDYGKQVWSEQMNGDKPKILHTTITGISNQQIAQSLLGSDTQKYEQFQLVKWSPQENMYLFLAKENDFENPCHSGSTPTHLYLFRWANNYIENVFELKNNNLLCGDDVRILYAPVALLQDKFGFSLLQTQMEGYAGGGASESTLHLIEIKDNQMYDRLTTYHGHFSDIAGEWHKDSTRDHDISEESCTLYADKKQIINDYYVFKKHCKSSQNGAKAQTSVRATFTFDSKSNTYKSNNPKEESMLQENQ